MGDGPYGFAFDSRNWIDEKEADPGRTSLVFAWAATPKMLNRIAGFAKLQGVWIGDGGRKNQAAIAGLHGIRVLRLNHAAGDDLDFLGGLADLRILELSSLKTKSLRGIERLQRLEYLVIDHAPNLHSLAPVAGLRALRHLIISTPASWDSSRRCIEVDTLKPLSKLSKLELLTLRGVRPAADALRPLEVLKILKEVEISHVPDFGVEDFARLAGALPKADGHCLQPHFRMNFPWPCKRCKATQEWLTGVSGKKRYLCPSCDKDKLAAHVAEFERIKSNARAAS